jgi:hypothetical protein
MNWSPRGVKLSKLMLSASVRLYSLLLWLYPRSFRRQYGKLMIQLFRDMTEDAIQQRGVLVMVEIWGRVAAELHPTVWEQHSIARSFYRYRGSQKAVRAAIIVLLFLIAGWLYLT